jgi:hypothetical protein
MAFLSATTWVGAMLSVSSLLALTRVLLGSPSGIWPTSDSEVMAHEADHVDRRERNSQSDPNTIPGETRHLMSPFLLERVDAFEKVPSLWVS